MSTQSVMKALYGGAIIASLPTNLIDASDLREIPDHQEVFLRHKTLTSIVFDINEYQTTDNIEPASDTTTTNAGITNLSAGDTTVPRTDAAAATHHLKDVIAPPDYLLDSHVETTAVTLAQSSLSKYPTYLSAATIIAPEVDRSAQTQAQSTLPVAWQSNPAQGEYQTKTQQLLVRMEEHATDLCVRINVPLKEFSSPQSEAALTEIATADLLMRELVQSLNVKDFGLFGGGGE